MIALLDTTSRVDSSLRLYSAADASMAKLLCVDRDPAALAHRIVDADLTARDISYGELREESERFAAALRELGVRAGDRVATLMGKGRAFLVTLLGIWRLGAVHVPLFTIITIRRCAIR